VAYFLGHPIILTVKIQDQTTSKRWVYVPFVVSIERSTSHLVLPIILLISWYSGLLLGHPVDFGMIFITFFRSEKTKPNPTFTYRRSVYGTLLYVTVDIYWKLYR